MLNRVKETRERLKNKFKFKKYRLRREIKQNWIQKSSNPGCLMTSDYFLGWVNHRKNQGACERNRVLTAKNRSKSDSKRPKVTVKSPYCHFFGAISQRVTAKVTKWRHFSNISCSSHVVMQGRQLSNQTRLVFGKRESLLLKRDSLCSQGVCPPVSSNWQSGCYVLV